MDEGAEFHLDPRVFMSPMIKVCNGDLIYTTLWGRSAEELRKTSKIIQKAFPHEEETDIGPRVDIKTLDPSESYKSTLYKVQSLVYNIASNIIPMQVMSIGVTDASDDHILPIAPPPMANANSKVIRWTGIQRDLHGCNAHVVEKELRDAVIYI